MRPSPRLLLLAAILPTLLAAGCSKALPTAADSGAPQKHHHHPPHGGTPVVLGDEDYHVELVLDSTAGKLQAFILDGEMENFVRSSTGSIVIGVSGGNGTRQVVLAAVPNPETGETVGDTALFEGQADWLRGTGQFDGVLRSVTIRGATFTDVKFNFPKGNDTGD
jgi:hypothetical protein